MTFKILVQAVFINACLALWPMFARKSGMPGYTVNLFYYIGSMASVAFLWSQSSRDGTQFAVKWITLIAFMGVLSGYCMNLYTTIVVNPKIQAGIFMLTSALLYAFFSLVFDWLMNGSKLSRTQYIGAILAFVAVYCMSGKK